MASAVFKRKEVYRSLFVWKGRYYTRTIIIRRIRGFRVKPACRTGRPGQSWTCSRPPNHLQLGYATKYETTALVGIGCPYFGRVVSMGRKPMASIYNNWVISA